MAAIAVGAVASRDTSKPLPTRNLHSHALHQLGMAIASGGVETGRDPAECASRSAQPPPLRRRGDARSSGFIASSSLATRYCIGRCRCLRAGHRGLSRGHPARYHQRTDGLALLRDRAAVEQVHGGRRATRRARDRFTPGLRRGLRGHSSPPAGSGTAGHAEDRGERRPPHPSRERVRVQLLLIPIGPYRLRPRGNTARREPQGPIAKAQRSIRSRSPREAAARAAFSACGHYCAQAAARRHRKCRGQHQAGFEQGDPGFPPGCQSRPRSGSGPTRLRGDGVAILGHQVEPVPADGIAR